MMEIGVDPTLCSIGNLTSLSEGNLGRFSGKTSGKSYKEGMSLK